MSLVRRFDNHRVSVAFLNRLEEALPRDEDRLVLEELRRLDAEQAGKRVEGLADRTLAHREIAHALTALGLHVRLVTPLRE